MPSPSDAIARELVSETEIRERVTGLAEQIQGDFRDSDLVVVGLLTGTLMFLADLVRKIDLPLRLDFIGVSSYRDGTESAELVFTKELRLDVRDRDVLLVDDILDTGKTLRAVIGKLESMQPRKISTCVLLSKQARREYDIPADYVGFEIPNEFVVGYGLDHAEQHRNLPFIGVLNVSSEPFSVMQSKPHIKLTVRFWSYFADVTGCRETAIEAEAGSTLGQLHDLVCKQFPKLAEARNSTLKAVGLDYQDDDFVLSDGDEVSLFPPVQGG